MEKKTSSGLLVNDGSFMERFNKLQQEKEKDSKLSPNLSGNSTTKTFSKIGSESKATGVSKTSKTLSNGKLAFKLKQKQKPKLVEAPIKLNEDENEDRKRDFIPSDNESTKRQKLEQIDATNQSSKRVDFAPPPPLPSDPTVKMVADKLASFVAKNGRQFEDVTRQKNPGNTPFKFLFDKSCDDYKYYVQRLNEEEKAQLQSVDPHTSHNGVASSSTFNSRSGSQISHEQHPNYQIPASALYIDTKSSRASDLGLGQVCEKSVVVVAKKFVEAKNASKAKKATGVASEEYGLTGNNRSELCVHTQDFDGDIAMNKSSIFVNTEVSLTSAERLEADKGTEAGINSGNTCAISIFGLNTNGGLDGPENALQANVDAELGDNNDDGIGCDVNVNSEEDLNTNPPPSGQTGIEENDLEENVSEGISASNNEEGNGPVILGSNEVVVSLRENPQGAEMRIVPAAGVVREDDQAIFVRPKRIDIAGAVCPLGTMVVDDVPLSDESGGTWRGFRLGASSVALIKQLEDQVPDFYDGVTYSSEKRAIQSLELLVCNLDRFFHIGLDHLSNKDLNVMRAEFEDLGRDRFRVEWAFHSIDQVLGIRASNERFAGLQENLGNLRSRAARLKTEVEDFKRKAKLAEEELTSVETQIFGEERELEVVASALNEKRGSLSNFNLFSESISQNVLHL